MSNEIDFKLVADSRPYVEAVRKAIEANKQLSAQVRQNSDNERRAYTEINSTLLRYQNEKRKSADTKEFRLYNAKLNETKQRLNEVKDNTLKYTNEQKKLGNELNTSTKKHSIFSGAILKITAAVGGAVGAFNVFKNIINSTQAAGDAFANAIGGAKEAVNALYRTIATGDFGNLIENMISGYEAGKAYSAALDEISDRTRAVKLRETQAQGELQELLIIMTETETRTYDERIAAAERYKQINSELLAANLDISEKALKAELDKAKTMFKLKDEEVERLKEYVINYDKLSDGELKAVEKVKKAREELAQVTETLKTPQTKFIGEKAILIRTDSEQKALIERRDVLKKYLEDTVNALTEEERRWLEMEPKVQLFLDTHRDALAKALSMRAEANNNYLANERTIARRINAITREKAAKDKQEKEAELSRVKKLGEEILRLTDEYNKRQIEKLTGLERIEAEEKYHLESIEKTKAYLSSLGSLTSEHLALINKLESEARDNAKAAREKYASEILQKEQEANAEKERERLEHIQRLKEIDEQELAYRRDVELSFADLMDETGMARLEVLKKHKQEEVETLKALYLEQFLAADESSKKLSEITMHNIELRNNEIVSLSQQIEKIKKQYTTGYVNAFKEALGTVTSMLQETYNLQLEFHRKERQLLEDKISALERSLEKEMEDREKGYAHSVESKRKELELLKAEKEKALENEKKIAEAQQKIQEAIQIMQIITASAQIFNVYSAIPGGTIIAIGLISLMLAAFVKAKMDAKKYATLEKGGSGTKTGFVTGKKHISGGEPFLEHIEVESGEAWGVLSANKTAKYGKQFHEIVNAMNEGKFEMMPKYSIPISNNNIIVNTDLKRLESLEGAMRDVEKAIKEQPQIYYLRGKRIEKKGRNMRVIYEEN